MWISLSVARAKARAVAKEKAKERARGAMLLARAWMIAPTLVLASQGARRDRTASVVIVIVIVIEAESEGTSLDMKRGEESHLGERGDA